MNREIATLREVVTKLTQLLAGKGLKVTQQGVRAFVETNPRTNVPVRVNIPHIPDNASPELILAIQGFIDHEVGHILETDFSILSKSLELGKKIKILFNIIEDTFVERQMGKRFPGSKSNLRRLHEFFIDQITKPALEEKKIKGKPMNEFKVLLVPIARAWSGQVIFDEFLTKENHWEHPVVKEFVKLVPDELRDRLKTVKNSAESLEIAVLLHEILYPPRPPAPPAESDEKAEGSAGDGKKPHDSEDKEEDDDLEDDLEDDSSDRNEEGGDASAEENDEENSEDEDDGKDPEEDSEDDSKDAGDEESSADGADDAGDGDDTGDADDDTDAEDGDSGDHEEEPSDDDGDRDDAGSDSDKDDSEDADDKSGAEDDDGDDDTGDDAGEEVAKDEEESDSTDAGGSEDTGDTDEQDGDEGSSDAEDEEDTDAEDEAGSSGDGDGEDKEEAGSLGGDDSEDGEIDDAVDPDDDESTLKKGRPSESTPSKSSAFEEDELEMDSDDEFDEALQKKITDEALRNTTEAEYRIFSRDFDIIEPYETDPKKFDHAAMAAIEEETRHMVGKMQKDIERMMAQRSYVVKVPGFRRGRLHGGALHRIVTGDDRVFRKKQEHTATDTAVSLLIDNSGSMIGTKHKTAMTAAYALSSTLERVGITHEAIGFTTCNHYGHYVGKGKNPKPGFDMRMIDAEASRLGITFSRVEPLYMPIFKAFDERLTPQIRQRFAEARGNDYFLMNNVDGECVEIAAVRLLTCVEKRKVMIVLSDGHPACDGDAREQYAKLHSAIREAEQKGVEIVGIGINSDAVRTFYKKHIVLRNLASLPSLVMSQLKNILLD